MTHPIIEVTGRTKENMFPYRIGFSTAISRQFAVQRNRATEGAFFLEFLNSAGPRPEWLARESGKTGAALREYIQRQFGYHLGIRVYFEQLPAPGNQVTLNSTVRDYFGNPVPHIQYSVGQYEQAAIQSATRVAAQILQQAGAAEIRVTRSSYAAHQIGTVVMGKNPESSVVNEHLRAHDVDNLYLMGSGCFPSATCTHPTLTISALAIRAAERIASHLAAPN